MDKVKQTPQTQNSSDSDSDSAYKVEPKPNYLVTSVGKVGSDETIQEQPVSASEFEARLLGEKPKSDLEFFEATPDDQEPSSSSGAGAKHKDRGLSTISKDAELIKSFVVDVPDSPPATNSDSEEDGVHYTEVEGCHGYLNVCMDRESKDDHLSALRRLRSEKSRRVSKYERAGLRGLLNIGNTCFMNSILQCLSNTAPLLRYILHDKFVSEVNTVGSSLKGNLWAAFVRLVKELWRQEGTHALDTSMVKGQLQIFAPRFKGYAQHDSQELLRYLLEILHYELNRVQKKPAYVPFESQPDWSMATHSLNAWKSYIRVDNSQIVDIFVGQLRSTLCCCVCRNVSVTFDPFWDLSISIPAPRSGGGEVTLEQCLDSFTRQETLDGDEKPFCSKCKVNQKSTKCFMIERFPEVLVIHLKRFKDEGKLRTIVRFPLLGLDIGPYSSSKTNCCSYNLYGISNHTGNTFSGHYIAYCKHPYNNCWSCYDDTNVHSTPSQTVKEVEAYVLFYEMSEGSKSVLF